MKKPSFLSSSCPGERSHQEEVGVEQSCPMPILYNMILYFSQGGKVERELSITLAIDTLKVNWNPKKNKNKNVTEFRELV